MPKVLMPPLLQLGFFDRRLGVLEDVVQVVEGGACFLGQRGLDQGRGLAALVGTGQEQHVIDDAAQALQLLQVRLQHFEIVFGAGDAWLTALSVSAD